MAFTQQNLDDIEAAIGAGGEASIRGADGRMVTYRTIDELVKARDTIKTALAAQSAGRRGVYPRHQLHPQFTLADRVVSWFAPTAAVKRFYARSVLAAFEAGRPDRQRKGRRATGSANDEVLRAGSTLWQTARHLEQNYDLALGVLNTLVVNTVGPNGIGIEPQPRTKDGTIDDLLARQILKLHKQWVAAPEVTRQHDWPSCQRMLARSWFRDGEVFSQLLSGFVPPRCAPRGPRPFRGRKTPPLAPW
eukprot:gene625-827_t